MTLWTNSEQLKKSPKFAPRDFCETLDGGQAFRWHKLGENFYEGVFGKFVARLNLNKEGFINASFPQNLNLNEAQKALLDYLDFERDYRAIIAAQKDGKVKNAAKEYGSLRILRQSPSEAIIGFICSSSKRIVQIKQCVGLLAQNLGEPICDSHKALPSFENIANAPDEVLKSCKLGFRAAYLKKTAIKILNDKFEPESLREMNYAESKKYLLTLNGVGEKVADCILLFGAAKFEAFPVDTWISKTMAELYALPNPKSVREFAAKNFGEHAGFVQQILFSQIRAS